MGIVIKVRDEAGNIETYETINIGKIDKQGPTFLVETESTSNSITVNVGEILDTQVGIEEPIKIKYYITTNKSELENIEGEELTETTKKYTELIQNTTKSNKAIAVTLVLLLIVSVINMLKLFILT